MCARVIDWSHAQKSQDEDGVPQSLNLGTREYKDLLMHLQSTLRHTGPVPAWLTHNADNPDPIRLISFTNGVLYLDGSSTVDLTPGTPGFFDPHCVPVALDPDAICPAWMEFMDTSLNTDDEGEARIALLQEWLGYCLTPTQNLEKMLFMVGPPASGKGTVIDAIQTIFGPLFTSFSISDLGGKFGLQLFPGKRVAAWSEATNNATGDGDVLSGFQRLISLVGGDQVYINIKGQAPVTGPLPTKIIIAANNFLELPDGAAASVRRLLPLEFPISHQHDADTDLKRKIRAEASGILAWAVRGLLRLMQNGGKFTMPPSSEKILLEWKTEVSPLASFVEECIVEGRGIDLPELRAAFNAYLKERGQRPLSNAAFLRMCKCNAGVLKMMIQGERVMFPGLAVKLDALRRAGVPR